MLTLDYVTAPETYNNDAQCIKFRKYMMIFYAFKVWKLGTAKKVENALCKNLK